MSETTLRRTESHTEGARGNTLFQRAWLPANPERVLLLVHGFAEHCGRYEHVAAWFAAHGCAIHAYDQEGHGHSSGTRGHIRRFDDFLDDLELQLSRARAQHPELPIFLVGHSMGGLIVTALARERRPDVAGVVISAPALMLNVSRTAAILARVASRLVPRLRRPAGIDPKWLSRDAAVVQAYRDDPLVFEGITASLGAALFGAAARCIDAGGDVRVPTMMIHGEADRICSVEGTRHFFEQLGVEKRLRTYPNLYHEAFNEPEQTTVFRDILEWIREIKPPASARPGSAS